MGRTHGRSPRRPARARRGSSNPCARKKAGLRGANGAVAAPAGSPATRAAGGGEAVPMRFSSVWRLGETETDSEHGQHVFGPARLRLHLPPDFLDVAIHPPPVSLPTHPLPHPSPPSPPPHPPR